MVYCLLAQAVAFTGNQLDDYSVTTLIVQPTKYPSGFSDYFEVTDIPTCGTPVDPYDDYERGPGSLLV